MNKIYYLIIVLISALILGGCNQGDIDELTKRINKQEEQLKKIDERVKNLETLVQTANSEIKTINDLLKVIETKVSIVSYKELADKSGYELAMSDGSTIVLQNGKSPIVSVKTHTDGFFYWTLNGDWMLDAKGNKVRAEGLDGKTPQMRVNASNQWETSLDGGTNWQLVTNDKGEAVIAKGESGKDGDAKLQITETYDSITIVYKGEMFRIPKGVTPEPFPVTHTFYKLAEFNVSDTPGVFTDSHKNDKSGYYKWEQAKTACPDGYRLPTKVELYDFAPSFFSFPSDSEIYYAIIGEGTNKAAYRYQKFGKYGWFGKEDMDAHFEVTGRYLGETFSSVDIQTISNEEWWKKHNEKDITKIFPAAGVKFSNGRMESSRQASFWSSERRGDEDVVWHWNTSEFGASIGVYSIEYHFSVRCIRK